MSAPSPTRPRRPTGNHPSALGEPHAERVLAITLALAGEIAVLHEKLDTIARVASEQERFTLADLEAYQPSPEAALERDAWRKAYIQRVLRVLHDAAPGASDDLDYAAFVKEIS